MRGLTLLALFGVCLGQKPARIGPDGKPLLNRPDLAECMKSKCWMLICSRQIVISVCVSGKSHMKVGNHNYFLSWREPWHKFEVGCSPFWSVETRLVGWVGWLDFPVICLSQTAGASVLSAGRHHRPHQSGPVLMRLVGPVAALSSRPLSKSLVSHS